MYIFKEDLLIEKIVVFLQSEAIGQEMATAKPQVTPMVFFMSPKPFPLDKPFSESNPAEGQPMLIEMNVRHGEWFR